MPVVTITMAKERTYDQKKKLSEEIARSVTTVLGVPLERECNQWGKRFRSLGKNPLCPDCNSDDVSLL